MVIPVHEIALFVFPPLVHVFEVRCLLYGRFERHALLTVIALAKENATRRKACKGDILKIPTISV
jgi:hypothetical protein